MSGRDLYEEWCRVLHARFGERTPSWAGLTEDKRCAWNATAEYARRVGA